MTLVYMPKTAAEATTMLVYEGRRAFPICVFHPEFVKTVAEFFYATFFKLSSGLSGLRTMVSGLSQFLVSPPQRDGLAALAWR